MPGLVFELHLSFIVSHFPYVKGKNNSIHLLEFLLELNELNIEWSYNNVWATLSEYIKYSHILDLNFIISVWIYRSIFIL